MGFLISSLHLGEMRLKKFKAEPAGDAMKMHILTQWAWDEVGDCLCVVDQLHGMPMLLVIGPHF